MFLKFVSIVFTLLIVFVQLPETAFAEDGMPYEGEFTPVQEKTIYFPQFKPVQSVANEDYMLFRIEGKVVLIDDCLRVVYGNKSYLLIWPGWYTFDIISRDIVVTHPRTGSLVARFKLGDTLSLSGGELEERPIVLKYIIPAQCGGPYFAVGDIEAVQPKYNSFKPEIYTSKPVTPEKQFFEPKRFYNPDNQSPKKPDKEVSRPYKTYNKHYKALHQSGKSRQKPVKQISKPSNKTDNTDDKKFEESILK